MIKERPILFSTAMVQAILKGNKTMTRRIIKPQPDPEGEISYMPNAPLDWVGDWTPWKWDTVEGELISKHCPYGMPGDILWVRESFCNLPEPDSFGNYLYKAAGDTPYGKWKPSIHMPKEASRIRLKVTGVSAERLWNITANEVRLEGVKYPVVDSNTPGMVNPVFKLGDDNGAINFMPVGWEEMHERDRHDYLLKAHFAELWCEINGRESWDANPWVWVVSFKVLSTTGRPNA